MKEQAKKASLDGRYLSHTNQNKQHQPNHIGEPRGPYVSTMMVLTKQNPPRSYIVNKIKPQKAPDQKHHMRLRVRKLTSIFIFLRIKFMKNNPSTRVRRNAHQQVANHLARRRRSLHLMLIPPVKRRKTTPSLPVYLLGTASKIGTQARPLLSCSVLYSMPILLANGYTTGQFTITAQAHQWPMSLATSGCC